MESHSSTITIENALASVTVELKEKTFVVRFPAGWEINYRKTGVTSGGTTYAVSFVEKERKEGITEKEFGIPQGLELIRIGSVSSPEDRGFGAGRGFIRDNTSGSKGYF